LSEADLREAELLQADLRKARLCGADAAGANLSFALLVDVDVTGARLDGCRVFGNSAWGLWGTPASQLNLIITPEGEPQVTVDNLKVAQFVYLLLNNQEVRDVIQTVASKMVLILGRFSPERKPVLDAIRDKIRALGLVPMLFDFDRPASRDFTETVLTLAAISSFIISDLSSSKSNPLELQAVVPNFMIPLVPIIQRGEEPFAMFADLQRKYRWVLDLVEYDSPERLVEQLEAAVVLPALRKRDELINEKEKPRRSHRIEEAGPSNA
jgi:hypothetical protein